MIVNNSKGSKAGLSMDEARLSFLSSTETEGAVAMRPEQRLSRG